MAFGETIHYMYAEVVLKLMPLTPNPVWKVQSAVKQQQQQK